MSQHLPPLTLSSLRQYIVGTENESPLIDGSRVRYVFLDNAASTPTFSFVLDALADFMPHYSAVHRGTGFKAMLTTTAFDEAHRIAGEFVHADMRTNVVIFGKNTTEAVNKLANRCRWREGDVVLTTLMEHHSNDLPWRKHAKVIHVGVDDLGYLNMKELEEAFRKNKGRVRFLSVTGASNITGIINPIHDLAALAHRYGALIFVDAAQLAPHRPIDVLPDEDPCHIDFIAYAAHKMYAPFGTGVLIGPKEWFQEGEPDMVGGGIVDIVELDFVVWSQPPAREEAGSPNVPGAIALASSIGVLDRVGMDAIADHEYELLLYTLERMQRIDGVTIYGPTEKEALRSKVGVIPFNLVGKPHAYVGAVLSCEGGIGVRNGCFCAHPYVKRLLRLSEAEAKELTDEIVAGDRTRLPGMVRASFGCYNNFEDIDRFIAMLERIAKGGMDSKYIIDPRTGAYWPKDFTYDYQAHFRHIEFER